MSDDARAPLSPQPEADHWQPPHSPPEKLSSNSMLVTVDGHSEAVSSNLNVLDVVIQPDDHDWARGPRAHWQVSILVYTDLDSAGRYTASTTSSHGMMSDEKCQPE